MKYKPLTEKQIIISIDRLTRFKPTEEKYLRVFKDIIVSNLIEPKFKKTDLEYLEYSHIRDIATEIFKKNRKQNKQLKNNLDYISAIKLLKEDIPQNLKWLKCLKDSLNIVKEREEKKLLFPISCVVIVEGITEEILLPQFSKILNYDFDKYGIKVLPAGGKNQVVKLYYSLSEVLKLPIFILLDKDTSLSASLLSTT